MEKEKAVHAHMSEDKFLNAILYFIAKIDNGTLGKVKLAKLLFFADAIHYLKYGKGFLGEEYLKLEHGPFPQDFDARLNFLSGKYFLMEEPFFRRYNPTRFKLLPNYPPNLGCFSKNEKACLEIVIKEFYHHTARDLSNFSHKVLPWGAIPKYSPVPLELTSFSQFDPSKVENEEGGVYVEDPEVLKALERGLEN